MSTTYLPSLHPPDPPTPHCPPPPHPVVSRYAVFCCTSVSLDIFECSSILPRHRYYLVIIKVTTKAISGLIQTSHNDIFLGIPFFSIFFWVSLCVFFNVDSLFGEMNVVSSFFFSFLKEKKKKKTLRSGRSSFFCSVTQKEFLFIAVRRQIFFIFYK